MPAPPATRDGVLRASGGRVLNVTAVAPTFAEAQRLSREAAEAIEFDGKVFRRDIGWREARRLGDRARPSALTFGAMPELPEVETIVRDIRPALVGRQLGRVSLSHDDILRGVSRRRLLRAPSRTRPSSRCSAAPSTRCSTSATGGWWCSRG